LAAVTEVAQRQETVVSARQEALCANPRVPMKSGICCPFQVKVISYARMPGDTTSLSSRNSGKLQQAPFFSLAISPPSHKRTLSYSSVLDVIWPRDLTWGPTGHAPSLGLSMLCITRLQAWKGELWLGKGNREETRLCRSQGNGMLGSAEDF
jgi:hypothetical protein